MATSQQIIQGLRNNTNVVVSCQSKEHNKVCFDLFKLLSSKKEATCIVTINKSATDMTEKLKKWNVETSKFFFIDATEKSSEKIENCISVCSSRSLTGLALAVSKVVETKQIKYLVFDSISTLLIYNDALTTTKFLHSVMTKLRDTAVKGIYFITKEDMKKVGSNLTLFADTVIE